MVATTFFIFSVWKRLANFRAGQSREKTFARGLNRSWLTKSRTAGESPKTRVGEVFSRNFRFGFPAEPIAKRDEPAPHAQFVVLRASSKSTRAAAAG